MQQNSGSLRRDLAPFCFSAILLYFAFPPVGASRAAYVALMPVLLKLPRMRTRNACVAALLSSTLLYAALQAWLARTTFLGLVGVSLYFAAYFTLWVFLVRVSLSRLPATSMLALLTRPLCVALAWSLCELLRTYTLYRCPQLLLVHTQAGHPERIQLAEYLGAAVTSGVLIAFPQAAIAQCIMLFRRPQRKRVAWVACALALLIAAGLFVANRAVGARLEAQRLAGRRVRMALAQANVRIGEDAGDPALLGGYATYPRMAADIRKYEPDILILPESALPYPISGHPPPRALVTVMGTNDTAKWVEETLVADSGMTLAAGTAVVESNRWFNAGMVYGDGSFGLYRKRILVPFGEYVPFRLPFIGKLYGMGPRVYPGTKAQDVFLEPNSTTSFRLNICYEIAHPSLVAGQAKGVHFLVHQANEEWMDSEAGSRQHTAHAVLRAIENRVAIAKSANGGITALVNPSGRLDPVLNANDPPLDKPGVMVFDAACVAERPRTFYARHRRLVEGVSALSFLLLALIQYVASPLSATPPDRGEERQAKHSP